VATIRVRVSPGAREDAIVGWQGDALKVRVKAPPERGRANQAVCDLLAELLGVARSAVTVERGHGSRDKVLAVDGLTEGEVLERLGRIQPE